MTETPPPAPKPKMSPVLRVVIVIAGIVAIVGGIMKMKQGFGEMSGTDPEITRLSEESDSAFATANKSLAEAAPALTSVLESVDRDGLAAVRAQKKEAAAKAAALYKQASEQLRLAAQKAADAAARKPGEKLQVFLETKADAYRNFASARDISQEIALMVLDESIKTSEELAAKITEAAKRSEKLEASANEAIARADKMVADSKK